jgi:hypothetical protein
VGDGWVDGWIGIKAVLRDCLEESIKDLERKLTRVEK